MSDQADTERKRRERARLASAFERRAWQPSERSKLPVRLLGGGVALAVAAVGTFGIGALISYQQGIEDDEKRRQAALHQRAQPFATSPTPTPSPTRTSPKPKPKPPSSSPAPRKLADSKPTAKRKKRSRFPTGPNFSTTTGVLLRNVMTGMCLDVPGGGEGAPGDKVQQDPCTRSTADNQLWDLVVNQKGAGPKGADLFSIRNYKDGLCLDLDGTGAAPSRSFLKQGTCRAGAADNQMWYLDRKAKGRFWIRNHKSNGLCLDVQHLYGAGGRGAGITLYPCDIKDDHLWSFG